jgi:hypothetical protein
LEVWKPRPKVLFKRKNPAIVLSAHCLVSTNFLHYLLQKTLTIIPISTFFSEGFFDTSQRKKSQKTCPKVTRFRRWVSAFQPNIAGFLNF